MAAKKVNFIQPKAEVEFNFSEHNIKDLLKRTTEKADEKLWKNIIKFDIDLSIFHGYDCEMETPLDQLKNKRLVYSLILHFLGRSIFCSKQVHEKFKLLLKKRLKDSCNELDPSNYKKAIEKLSAKSNHTIQEIMAPYNQLCSDFIKWSNEKITWDQHVEEVSFRETIMCKLREKCNRYDIADSSEFFSDFLANLQLDNYCFKGLKNAKGNKEWIFVSERTINWMFPLEIEVRVEQKKELQGFRRDNVTAKEKNKYTKIEYKNIDRDLDPYMHGGHFRSIFSNEMNELEYYMKKHPGRQLITEVAFLMFGVEVQKNPAALIYNMMIVDLIDGDKVSQREIYYSRDPEHSKEKGNGGLAPYSFDGAATASRYLNIYYSYIFDHWYSYDITDESEEKIFENLMDPNSDFNQKREYKIRFEEMMQREYDLVIKWINYKKERDRKARYLKTIQELYNYILAKTTEYYEQYKITLK
ncbi:unnamed protein product [Brachionus calyciflorus]|uniref:Uncharacterized protein n=1 Tax=Brachionus calyciflorus TaxID=104777 RepID=A0A814GBK4_9BILA|nr:unnamed protein product [Brachionus calyciflorus]